VRLVPTGTDGVVGIGITVRTPEPARMMAFYLGAMEFDAVGPRTARCGDTLLFVEKGPGGSPGDDFVGPAFRYLTVQIFDADEACRGIVARGGTLARAPVSFGQVARFGFVADPDGNWIEISARASLTGIVPPADR
jgi:lactoylglutathione lyase